MQHSIPGPLLHVGAIRRYHIVVSFVDQTAATGLGNDYSIDTVPRYEGQYQRQKSI